MKQSQVLTITSLLAILLAILHVADDIVRGFEPGGFKNASGILIFSVWLYGTIALSERRSGYIIKLLGALLGTLMPLAHMRGAGLVGGRMINSNGRLLFVFTLMTLGVTALVSVVLSIQGLWRMRRAKTEEIRS